MNNLSTKPTSKGQQTQAAILETAVKIASVEGLDGITIGRLASELNMSKSGLFRHFGSKEGLQLAIIEDARITFIQEVIMPVRPLPPGTEKIWALCDSWLTYMEHDIFPGGCFFLAVSHEFDNKPGKIRDLVAQNMQEWFDYLKHTTLKAQSHGFVKANVDCEQVAFEIHSLYTGANWARQLFKDDSVSNRARVAIEKIIKSISIDN